MKYLFCLLVVLCMYSCDMVEREYKYMNETNNCFRDVKEFMYNEHEYIKFSDNGYKAGVVHNPDCKKCKLIQD